MLTTNGPNLRDDVRVEQSGVCRGENHRRLRLS